MGLPTGRYSLRLVLVDTDEDGNEVSRSGLLKASWSKAAVKELSEAYGLDASEEVLKFFTAEVLREVPAALRSLLERSGAIQSMHTTMPCIDEAKLEEEKK
jgi:hypothetical protein